MLERSPPRSAVASCLGTTGRVPKFVEDSAHSKYSKYIIVNTLPRLDRGFTFNNGELRQADLFLRRRVSSRFDA